MSKTDLILPAHLLEGIENYSTVEVANFIKDMQQASVKLFMEKDKDYGGSWQKKGIFSAQSNFERKIDRVNAQFYNGTMTSGKGENIADTFIDTATYSLMYLFYLSKKDEKVRAHVQDFIKQYK